MNKSQCAWLAWAAVLLITPIINADDDKSTSPPNIVLIVADNLGYGDLGCYGQRRIKTPHIDRMAAEGMRFTQFYAGSSVCAPSRCVLMTGLHTGHCRIRRNEKIPSRQTLLPEDVTIAEILKGGGYATALIGKWGLGEEGSSGLPNRQGFDYFFGYLNQVHAHNYYPDFLWRNQEKVLLPNVVVHPKTFAGYAPPELVGAATKRVQYAPDLFTKEALEFITRQSKTQPFFLYLPYNYPHPNCEAPDLVGRHGAEVPSYGLYADTDWPDTQKGHAAMISRLDADVGRILAALKDQGLDGNTLVMFVSDNGPHRGHGLDPEFNDSNGPFRGALGDLYEGSLRVPLVVRWPGRVPEGKVSDHVAWLADMLATTAEAAGVRPPKTDGISFLNTLLGRNDDQDQHDYLYWESYGRGKQWEDPALGSGPGEAVRMGDWKAIRQPLFTGPIKLFDLRLDIGERRNVAEKNANVVARMREIMLEAHVGDQRPR